MSLFDKIGDSLKKLDPTDRDSLIRQGFRVIDPTQLSDVLKQLDPSGELEKIAVPLAQTWRNDHPNAQPGSQQDYDDCVLVVAAGVASAAAAFGAAGGPAGAALGAGIGAGGGYAAARLACRRIIGSPSNDQEDLIIRDGLLIKGSDHPIYIIRGGQRRWIPNPQTFNKMGLDWNAVLTVKDNVLNTIPKGDSMPSL